MSSLLQRTCTLTTGGDYMRRVINLNHHQSICCVEGLPDQMIAFSRIEGPAVIVFCINLHQ